MESGERRRKPGCWRMGCLSTVLIAAVFWAFAYLPHDIACWRLQRSFSRLQHPPGTRLIACRREVGNEVGNGDHLDYFVGELRSYSGSRDRISTFYAQKTIYDPALEERSSVGVAFIKRGKLEGWIGMSVPDTAADMVRLLGARAATGRYYVVYVVSRGDYPYFDIRGM